jgi:hypothetical protein
MNTEGSLELSLVFLYSLQIQAGAHVPESFMKSHWNLALRTKAIV